MKPGNLCWLMLVILRGIDGLPSLPAYPAASGDTATPPASPPVQVRQRIDVVGQVLYLPLVTRLYQSGINYHRASLINDEYAYAEFCGQGVACQAVPDLEFNPDYDRVGPGLAPVWMYILHPLPPLDPSRPAAILFRETSCLTVGAVNLYCVEFGADRVTIYHAAGLADYDVVWLRSSGAGDAGVLPPPVSAYQVIQVDNSPSPTTRR